MCASRGGIPGGVRSVPDADESIVAPLGKDSEIFVNGVAGCVSWIRWEALTGRKMPLAPESGRRWSCVAIDDVWWTLSGRVGCCCGGCGGEEKIAGLQC